MQVITKTPVEVITAPVSVSDDLDGAAVTGAAATLTAMGLVSGAALAFTISETASGAQLQLSAGTDGEIYRLDVRLDLDDDRVLERALEVHVVDLTFAVPQDGAPTSYVTPTDYMDRFGIEELIDLTCEAGQEPRRVNKKRFFAALTDAAAEIDGILSERFVTPIENPPAPLKTAALPIAREFLHRYADAVPEHIEKAATAARGVVRRLVTVDLSLAGLTPRTTTPGMPEFTAPGQYFTTDRLKRF